MSTRFVASIHTPAPPPVILALFWSAGWRIRTRGHGDTALVSDVGDLVVEGRGPVLLHGRLASAAEDAPRIVDILRRAGLRCSAELYDDDHRVTASWDW